MRTFSTLLLGIALCLPLCLAGRAALEAAPKKPLPAAGKLIEGKLFKGMAGEALRLENEHHVTVRGCVFENVGIAVRLVGCTHVTIENCVMRDLCIMGVDVRGGCSDIRIANNVMHGFRGDVQGGHFISTEKTPTPKQYRISIVGNVLRGNGKSWVSGRKNGAAGDMLALRSVSGFVLRDNDLSGGGEFGMNCLYGCERGVVAGNRIQDTDGTGLLIGYGVRDIAVTGNVIVDCGMSYETDGSTNDITHQAGMHCRNGAEHIAITGNVIVRREAPEMRYGIHLRETQCVIQGNRIAGVDKAVHVPKSLLDTVEIGAGTK